MDLQLKGKVALVLAASKGLGKATAMALAAEGVHVVIGAREPVALEEAAREIRTLHPVQVIALPVDVSKPGNAEQFISRAVDALGRIDILILNAGGPPFGKFESFGDADWQSAFELTLLSGIRFIRQAVPHMRKTGSGRIIHITSLSVKTYLENSILSTSIRMGVTGMAKMLSNELGPDNITVNCVAPGLFLTDRLRNTLLKQIPEGKTAQEILDEKTKDIPLGRFGQPDEFGALVAFLASPLAGYITGATIQVDGGAIKATY